MARDFWKRLFPLPGDPPVKRLNLWKKIAAWNRRTDQEWRELMTSPKWKDDGNNS